MRNWLRHMFGNHWHCLPYKCEAAAKLANEAESELRYRDYLEGKNK